MGHRGYICGNNGCREAFADIADLQNHRSRCKKGGKASTGQSAQPRATRYAAAVRDIMNVLYREEEVKAAQG